MHALKGIVTASGASYRRGRPEVFFGLIVDIDSTRP